MSTSRTVNNKLVYLFGIAIERSLFSELFINVPSFRTSCRFFHGGQWLIEVIKLNASMYICKISNCTTRNNVIKNY